MSLSNEDYKDIKSAKGKALANKVKRVTSDYGSKTNYPKRDIHVNGKYDSTTTWARSNKEARQRFTEKFPEHAASKIQVNRQK
ncbi:MAG: hypothetical protein IPP74_14615 [Alphaproteobacteria bacterium]|nr:hypothetical protein [Alphaproteobacteria bacterium]